MKKKRLELTRAELEIMQILWKKQEAFVNDILKEMPEPKPAYNTVSTIIRILEKKGVVSYRVFGKSHRYYPLVGKEDYTRSMMKNVVGNFFDNSVPQMFSFLTARENLSLNEMEEILSMAQKFIEEKKK